MFTRLVSIGFANANFLFIGIAKHFVVVSSLATNNTFSFAISPINLINAAEWKSVIGGIVSQMLHIAIFSSGTNSCLQFEHLVFWVKTFHIYSANSNQNTVIIIMNVAVRNVTFHFFLVNIFIYCIHDSFSGFQITFIIIYLNLKKCQWTTFIFYNITYNIFNPLLWNVVKWSDTKKI